MLEGLRNVFSQIVYNLIVSFEVIRLIVAESEKKEKQTASCRAFVVFSKISYFEKKVNTFSQDKIHLMPALA